MSDEITSTGPSGILDSPLAPAPPSPPKQFPGFLQALLLLVLIHLVANVVGAIVIVPGMIREYLATGTITQTMGLAAIGIAANSLAFGLVTWITWKRSKLSAGEAFPFAGVSIAQGFAMLLLFGGTVVLAELVSTGMFRLLPPWDFVREIFGQLLGQDAPLVLSAIFLVIIAPVTEELFFRGVLQRSLSIRYGPGKAIVYSGLLFGIVHLLPWQVVPAVVLGTLFAWFREKTGSLWPSLIAHAITNGTSLVMSRLHPEIDPLKPEWPEPIYLVGGALLLVLGGVLAGRAFRSVPSPLIVERSPV